MTQLLIILMVVFSSSAFAEMDRFYNNHVGGTVYGRSPNGISQYYDSRGTPGTILTTPPFGISPYSFNVPSGMMLGSGAIFNAPMGNTPMGMPAPVPDLHQIQPAPPMQLWTPSLPAGPIGR
jgi:hypothetical protein